jgi:hypothetical protein
MADELDGPARRAGAGGALLAAIELIVGTGIEHPTDRTE